MDQCVICKKLLTFDLETKSPDNGYTQDGVNPHSVPDEVNLQCGCRFHWQCLIDAYTITQCPNCGVDLISQIDGSEHIFGTLNNEGGLQENIDIFPLLREESYLKCYPEERKARALLEFCREGDLASVVNLLLDPDDDEEEEEAGQDSAENDNGKSLTHVDVLRYQDSLGNMDSSLHAAVVGGSREIVWLLLLMASSLDLGQFPPQVLEEARVLGIERGDMADQVDIRTLRNADGKSAEQLAAEVGGVWVDWLGTSRLAI